MPDRSPEVLFVVTPFLPEHQPALGVSTLLSLVRRAGHRAAVHYLNVQFMRQIGWELYYYLSYATPPEIIAGEMALLPASPDLLLGEMAFAPALWGDAAASWDEYADRIAPLLERKQHAGGDAGEVRREQALGWSEARRQIQALRQDSPRIVRQWAQEILARGPRVVGFTTTFQQNVASLALARELRRLAPPEQLTILLGGANCEGDMGRALADNFPFLDHVVAGEGEGVILDIVRTALTGAGGPHPRYVEGPRIEDMDSLPVPDFDDYFAAIEGTPMAKRANLTAESSRGCWWGAKSHCTFCGLNGSGMAYRSKDPEKFAAELRGLVERHGFNFFMMADNILDLKYVRSLFPALIEQGDEITMFYETKSNLKKEQLEVIVAGGVTELQPGIESLSTPILRLMGKGTTRLQNLQLIKWCEEYGIRVNWNILFGFPGEPPTEYAAMADLIDGLVHLPPPGGCGRIRLDRFSPYWKDPAALGMVGVRQRWSYDHVYAPLPAAERMRLAYYFDYDYQDGRDPQQYLVATLAGVERWRDAYSRQRTLEFQRGPDDTVTVLDTRGDEPVRTPLTPAELCALRALDAHRGPAAVAESLAAAGLQQAPAELAAMLASFVARRWTTEEGGKHLCLILDRSQRQAIIKLKMAAQLGAVDWAAHFDGPTPARPRQQSLRVFGGDRPA